MTENLLYFILYSCVKKEGYPSFMAGMPAMIHDCQ